MAYCFGDSFDLYAATADMAVGYWDSTGPGAFSLVAGRFSGSRALSTSASAVIAVKNSSVTTDPVHHIVFAVNVGSIVTANNSWYFTLGDGASAQCTVAVRDDGSIQLQSGAVGGTVLDTYSGAISSASQWWPYEIEIVINNTTGSWAVRKSGSTSNDHALSGLNTRAGSTNNQANRLTVGHGNIGFAELLDDLLWRSDASSVAWVGDIRCYTRMPASDSAVQFSRAPATVVQNIGGTTNSTRSVALGQ